ncbi:endogenous retrovirus group K member 6 Pro protein-like, partial [Gracilinanus agilis]|uniref:endogenous retrovirus group K member 6 Pro protein-like n=1 Tax=Gracilinanus agilis TaxID=191870 RepID=UPI001CFDD706
ATAGSAGLDLCTTSTRILTPEEGPVVLPTGKFGPPPPGMFFLVIGRALTTLQGIVVYPTLVDNDYTGEIKLIIESPHGPITIPAGQRLAQALPLPLIGNFPAATQKRGPSSPDSSNIYWVQQLTESRPTLQLKIEGKTFLGLLDTGADSTVIPQAHWPHTWPLQPSNTHLSGIGQVQDTLQSSKLLNWQDTEGNSGTTRPYVVAGLPVNLWGRDILAQMRLLMVSPSDAVTTTMLKSGYLPGKGLGKNEQGSLHPIFPPAQTDKKGFGSKNFS